MKRSSVRKLVLIAVFSAFSLILFIFPTFSLIPSFPFLKLDFSIIPILIILNIYGFKSAFVVLFVRSILKLLLFNYGLYDFVGVPMNFIILLSFIISFNKYKNTNRKYKFLIPVLVVAITSVLLNYFIFSILNIDKTFEINYSKIVYKYYFSVFLFSIIEGSLWSMVYELIEKKL